ncbi:endonuclease/exonuclease/phosphatase family protein [Desmospora profundinema]|uniref:Endonuclease/exonuclease/phosphatase family metal-dependent hydrolase n=1 Tax=Desmospora profundinema TaxID=1571184 RepID=A0ABU1IJR0_9BACL|nr:endonuclease/exonuclease/phosphatase family protein [Desmospora profundinema]MDR6225020.1 endonuclease/exonuclease/phosphatase family metal-dependent hydrolase [Desmospora profundinema]
MRVMSYNIRHGLGCDGRLDLERIANVIQAQQPDAVGLNEVDVRFHRRSSFEDQVDFLAVRLDMDAAFAPAIRIGGEGCNHGYGNALLVRKGGLVDHIATVFTREGLEPRSVLLAHIQLEGSVWRLAVTHVGFSPWMRRSQIRFLEQRAMEPGPPLVVMGDFNMGPGHVALAPLECRLTDVLSGVEDGTYPCRRPRRRIDGIYCSREVKVVRGWVVETPGCPSDHLPVMGEMQLQPSRQDPV